MLYYVYFSKAGVAKAGLTPVWNSLATAENGTDKIASAPAITEIDAANAPGWYTFEIIFGDGVGAWGTTTEDLVGIVDGTNSLPDIDRYKPVAITVRGLALAKLTHKAIQNKATGDVVVYATDGTTPSFKNDMTDSDTEITRNPDAP